MTPVDLSARARAVLLDLVDNAIATMTVVDREDVRWHCALTSARRKLAAAIPAEARRTKEDTWHAG